VAVVVLLFQTQLLTLLLVELAVAVAAVHEIVIMLWQEQLTQAVAVVVVHLEALLNLEKLAVQV
jgi:hypothetical protein